MYSAMTHETMQFSFPPPQGKAASRDLQRLCLFSKRKWSARYLLREGLDDSDVSRSCRMHGISRAR